MTVSMRTTLRLVLLVALVLSFLLSPLALAERIFGGWDATSALVGSTFIALEAYGTSLALRHALFSTKFGVRLGELMALGVFAQLYTDLVDGNPPLQAGLPTISLDALAVLVPALLTWVMVLDISRWLGRLGEPPVHDPRYVPPTRRLATRFFVGGVGLFVLSALMQPQVSRTIHLSHPDQPGPSLNVLLYFALGLLLLASLRLESMERRWDREHVVQRAEIGRRWLGWGLATLVALAACALLLPAFRLSAAAGLGSAAWSVISAALLHSGLVTKDLLGTLAQWVPLPSHRLDRHLPKIDLHLKTPLNLSGLHLHGPHRTPVHTPPHHGGGAGHGIRAGWIGWLEIAMFWGAVLGTMAMGVRFVRTHFPAPFGRLASPLAGLRTRLRTLWLEMLQRAVQRARERIDGLPLLQTSTGEARSHRRHRSAERGAGSARERVVRYYLNLVDGAKKRGVARQQAQTPQEFTAVLVPEVVEVQDDVQALTEAFVQARYSQEVVREPEAERAHASWGRVERALRRARAGRDGPR